MLLAFLSLPLLPLAVSVPAPAAWHWQSLVSDLPIKPQALAQGSGCRSPVDIHLEGEGACTSAAPLWLVSSLSHF